MSSPPPAKKQAIAFSLGNKSKKKRSSTSGNNTTNANEKKSKNSIFPQQDKNNPYLDDDEYENATSATLALLEAEKRKQKGEVLIIPVSKKDGGDRKKDEPLLEGLRQIISSKEKAKEKKEGSVEETDVQKNGDTSPNDGDNDSHNKDTDTKNKKEDKKEIEAEKDVLEAGRALIESAMQGNSTHKNITNGTNFSVKGSNIVIPVDSNGKQQQVQPQQSENDDVKFKRDMDKRAEDVSVHSTAYVNVPISEFGAAMLRGMGWKGNEDGNNDSNKNKNKNDKSSLDQAPPRPHRLGLGATPLPPSMKNGNNSSSGGGKGDSKRHWARKGGTKGDRAHLEKEEQQEKEWQAELEKKRKNDVQLTMQVGSVVYVRSSDNRRAKLVKIAGVPGLNQVLIRYEREEVDVSVKKGEVILAEKADVENNPFVEVPSQNNSKRKLKQIETDDGDDCEEQSEYRKESRSKRDQSRDQGEKQQRDDRKRSFSRDHDYEDRRSRRQQRSRSKDHNDEERRSRRRRRSKSNERDDEHRSRHRRRSLSRDRNDEEHRSRRRRRSRSRDRDEERRSRRHRRSRSRDRNEEEHRSRRRRRSRSRSRDRSGKRRSNHYVSSVDEVDSNHRRKTPEKEERQHSRHDDPQREELHWLLTNIRVRVVSKNIAKGRQYKQKGLVVDVLNGGKHAVLQMPGGEVIERVPERYLETALPKIGGHVVILTGANKYSKGRLLERNSTTCKGVIQLSEDMNLVSVSLDDIAEWCGPLDNDDME